MARLLDPALTGAAVSRRLDVIEIDIANAREGGVSKLRFTATRG